MSSNTEEKNAVTELMKQQDYIVFGIGELRAQIVEIKKQFPYKYKTVLEDPEQVKEIQDRLNQALTDYVFPDYQPEELTEIFIRMCSSNGYKLSDNALVTISERFRKMYENRDETFGNGCDVRNIFERAVTRQALRLSSISSPTNDEILTFEVSDVE